MQWLLLLLILPPLLLLLLFSVSSSPCYCPCPPLVSHGALKSRPIKSIGALFPRIRSGNINHGHVSVTLLEARVYDVVAMADIADDIHIG